MSEKIKELLEEGITEVIQSRYVDNNLASIKEEPQPIFKPKVSMNRLTEHYLPEKVKGD